MYAAMKAAMLSVTRSFAGELAEPGIRVNALAPGPVNTDMMRNLGEGASESMGTQTLLNRTAEPDEMVGAALYLASDASSYMTGQVLVVDGGLHPPLGCRALAEVRRLTASALQQPKEWQ